MADTTDFFTHKVLRSSFTVEVYQRLFAFDSGCPLNWLGDIPVVLRKAPTAIAKLLRTRGMFPLACDALQRLHLACHGREGSEGMLVMDVLPGTSTFGYGRYVPTWPT